MMAPLGRLATTEAEGRRWPAAALYVALLVVGDAIDRAEGTAPPPAKAKKHKNATVTGGSLGSLGTGYAANESDDLDTAC